MLIPGPVKKLIIQIPCLNEAATLPATLADLPRSSRDRRGRGARHRRRVARRHGRRRARAAAPSRRPAPPQQGTRRRLHGRHRRVAQAGADFIVNTDADNQYAGARNPAAARAAAERRGGHRHRRSQHRRAAAHVVAQAAAAALGSWVVRQVSNTRCRTRPAVSAPTRARRRCA